MMKINKSQLKQIIKEEVKNLKTNPQDEKLEEGLEQLTPENIELLFKVMEKFVTEPAIVTALGVGGLGAAIDQMKDRLKSKVTTGPTSTSSSEELTENK
jgi:hypothetical protein